MNKIKSRHIWTLLLLLTVLFDGGYAKATAISSTTYDFVLTGGQTPCEPK